MQVYDNRRAIDYLLAREEVDGQRLGITGASGGGNQTMYAGALDERFGAVVPVCSVGNYQSYLKAACCVCEVLPGALQFTEEGEVLGLVAPRALMVINASRDAYQFSPGQADKSIERARTIFDFLMTGDKLKHVVFESGHDYSRPMREAMYGWMSRWLKGEGDGKPIKEPEIALEMPEDLACFHDPDERPKTFLFPPSFAGQEARTLIAKVDKLLPRHLEEWNSTAVEKRKQLAAVLGEFPKLPKVQAKIDPAVTKEGVARTTMRLAGEGGIPLPLVLLTKAGPMPNQPLCVVLHLDGKAAAERHALSRELVKRGWQVAMPDLRATGETKQAGDAVRTAPDHNTAEYGVWLGRPLLGQWVFDIQCIVEYLLAQGGLDPKRVAVVGLEQAGLVALAAGAILPERITHVATVKSAVSLVTDKAYEDGTRMGLLAHNLFQVGDVPHLAALIAPRRMLLVDAVKDKGNRLSDAQFRTAMSFPLAVYKACQATDRITLMSDLPPDEVAAKL
jgi:dienelactone hydrolase